MALLLSLRELETRDVVAERLNETQAEALSDYYLIGTRAALVSDMRQHEILGAASSEIILTVIPTVVLY